LSVDEAPPAQNGGAAADTEALALLAGAPDGRSRVALGTVLKVGAVLELYSLERSEWGVSEIAKVLDLPKSSVAALATSMVSIGLLHRTGHHRYRLGWRFLSLSRTLVGSALFASEWREFVLPLAGQLQDTVSLAVFETGRVVYVDKLEGRDSVKTQLTGVGAERPPHSSAIGKVLLAQLPTDEQTAVLERRGLPAFTKRTITNVDRLREELARVTEQGYATASEEAIEGLCCVAAPVRDYEGDVVAAMSVSVAARKFYPRSDEYRRLLVQAAGRFSQRLGYFPGSRGGPTDGPEPGGSLPTPPRAPS
jgi:IclR family transcriptional regulator, KDG regulon repressor